MQVIFRKSANNYWGLFRKITYKNKASYDSTPPCAYLRRTITEIYLYIYVCTPAWVYLTSASLEACSKTIYTLHTCTHLRVYSYIHIYAHIHIYICTHTHIYTRKYIHYIDGLGSEFTGSLLKRHEYIYIYTYIHKYIRIHVYIYIFVHTYTNMHIHAVH